MGIKVRKFSILVCAFVFLITVMTACIGEVNYKSDPRTFKTEEAMVKASDTIVVGKVTNVQNPRKININQDKGSAPIEHVYTVSELKIENVLKGNVKTGEVIEIKQLGGKYKFVKYVDDNTTFLEKDKEYILFLESYKDNDPSMPYSIVTPSGGCFEVNSSETKDEILNHFKAIIK